MLSRVELCRGGPKYAPGLNSENIKVYSQKIAVILVLGLNAVVLLSAVLLILAKKEFA